MKKLLTLSVVSLVLFGCDYSGLQMRPNEEATIPTPPAEVLQDFSPEPEPVETPVVVEISVDSVANGDTVQTSPVVISGTVGEDVISVMVNDWELQSYEAGSGVWSYVAKPAFSNLQVGENIYTIEAKNAEEVSASITLNLNYQPAN